VSIRIGRRSVAGFAALVGAVVLAAAAEPVRGRQAPSEPFPAETRAKVDQVFAAFTAPGSPGCVVAVYRDGAIAYSRGYGLASLEFRLPNTPRTVFDIGSTGKQFTAFSILLLERDGRLSLDDDVRKFLPELPAYERTITIRHLLQHTSGLRDYLTLFALSGAQTTSWTTQQDAVRLVARQRRANFAAGDDWLYSNTGYLLLAEIVQRAAGKSLKEFARERIFAPLGMTHTLYQDDHAMVVPNKATGYDGRDGGGFRVEMSNFEQIGDGGVQTTVEDLLLWDRNFYDPKVGDRVLIQRAQQVGRLNDGKAIDYAAGLRIGEYRGLQTVRHGGAWAGYRAELLRFPRERTSVACLCNLASANPSQLADAVADVVLAGSLKPVPPPPGGDAAGKPAPAAQGDGPALAPTEIAGIYKRTDGVEYRQIRADGSRLLLGAGTVLAPLGANRFAAGQAAVVFSRPAPDAAIECRTVPVPGSSAKPTVFRKLPPARFDPQEFAGDYYSNELDARWMVRVANGRLAAGVRVVDEDLVPAEADTFLIASGVILVFERSGAEVRGLRLHAGRVRDLEFKKLPSAGPGLE
jgi:CubicO group peptidase (beta-lactamase class C family)